MLNTLFKRKNTLHYLASGVFIALFILTFQIISAPKVSAAYEGGRLIDDSVFLDAKSMSASDIQNFLVSKNSGLKSLSFNLSCYGSESKERQLYTAAGGTCDTPVPASSIIYYAAQIYGVNPKVIIATLQKEQSLITAPSPTDWQLSQAMGYACPTSGSCSASSNFSYQIDSGTWALRFHYERARGNLTWWYTSTTWTCGTAKSYYKPNLYPNQDVQFYDDSNVLYSTTRIENAATSAFYCYTPHILNNFPGCTPIWGFSYTSSLPTIGSTGNCYAGSANFVKFYETWFGSTKSGICNTSLTNAVTDVLFGNRYGKVGNANFLIYSGTSTGCVELHSWQQGTNFSSWKEHIATNSAAITKNDSQISFADLDGDGKDEMILIGLRNTASGKIEFHIWNNDLQSWQSHIISNASTIDSGISSVTFADLDGDGKDEGILIGQGNGSTSTGRIEFHVWNAGFGSWKEHIVSNSSTLDPLISSIRFADLDGDGKDEGILIGQGNGSTSTGRIEFHVWNAGFGSWRGHYISNSSTLDPLLSSVQFSDLDGDGKDEGILIGAKTPTGSGMVEFHVWNAGFGSWRGHYISNQSTPSY